MGIRPSRPPLAEGAKHHSRLHGQGTDYMKILNPGSGRLPAGYRHLACEHFIRTFMSKYERNTGKHWTVSEESLLRQLAKRNTPTRVIGLKLGRPEGGIYAKASELGIPLKPTNQSPYNR